MCWHRQGLQSAAALPRVLIVAFALGGKEESGAGGKQLSHPREAGMRVEAGLGVKERPRAVLVRQAQVYLPGSVRISGCAPRRAGRSAALPPGGLLCHFGRSSAVPVPGGRYLVAGERVARLPGRREP